MQIKPLLIIIFLNLSIVSLNYGQGKDLNRSSGDSTMFMQVLNQTKEHIQYHPDSAYYYLQQTNQYTSSLDSVIWYSELNNTYARLNEHLANYDKALNYLFNSRKFLEEKSRTLKNDYIEFELYKTYKGILNVYFILNKYEDALPFGLKAKEQMDLLHDANSNYYSPSNHLKALSNLASIYLQTSKYDLAESIYLRAIEINFTLDDEKTMAVLYSNLGAVYVEKEEFDKAQNYYRKALSIQNKTQDSIYMVQTFNNYGKYFILTNQLDSSFVYFHKAHNISTQIKSWKSASISTYFLVWVNKKQKNYQQALEYKELNRAYSDSLINEEKLRNMARTEAQYEFFKKQKEIEAQQRIQKAEHEKEMLQSRMIAGIAVFSVLILALLALLQRNKIRHGHLKQRHLKLEGENLKLTKINLEKELETKNKELATNVIYLIKKNEYITNTAEKLLNIIPNTTDENQKLLNSIVRDLQQNTETSVWQEFEIRFQNVHEEFYTKLNEQFPNLTPNERKLCAFLRLNMTTKEISGITLQTPKSITVARSRLRKKLNIDREENLIAYMAQL